MQLYYGHATKVFLQCFMILIGSNAGNAQQHISSTTHFILCCTLQMCIWKRKDGIEFHEFIFNSYDAPFYSQDHRTIQKVLVRAWHDAHTSTCDQFWIVDWSQREIVGKCRTITPNFCPAIRKSFPRILRALVWCSCDHPAILIVDRLQEHARSVVNDF